MSLVPTLLTSGFSLTPGTAFVTASVTLPANTLITIKLNNEKFPGPPAAPSSITSTGATWAIIDATNGTLSWGATFEQLSVFRTMVGSNQTGAITINFSASQDACGWIVESWAGAEISGSNGSGAIVQVAKNSGVAASGSVTLAAFGDATNNAATAAFCINKVENISVDTSPSGYAEIGEVAYTGFALELESEFRVGQDTAVGASWATATDNWGGIAFEVKAMKTSSMTISSPSQSALLSKINGIVTRNIPSVVSIFNKSGKIASVSGISASVIISSILKSILSSSSLSIAIYTMGFFKNILSVSIAGSASLINMAVKLTSIGTSSAISMLSETQKRISAVSASAINLVSSISTQFVTSVTANVTLALSSLFYATINGVSSCIAVFILTIEKIISFTSDTISYIAILTAKYLNSISESISAMTKYIGNGIEAASISFSLVTSNTNTLISIFTSSSTIASMRNSVMGIIESVLSTLVSMSRIPANIMGTSSESIPSMDYSSVLNRSLSTAVTAICDIAKSMESRIFSLCATMGIIDKTGIPVITASISSQSEMPSETNKIMDSVSTSSSSATFIRVYLASIETSNIIVSFLARITGLSMIIVPSSNVAISMEPGKVLSTENNSLSDINSQQSFNIPSESVSQSDIYMNNLFNLSSSCVTSTVASLRNIASRTFRVTSIIISTLMKFINTAGTIPPNVDRSLVGIVKNRKIDAIKKKRGIDKERYERLR